MLCNRRGRTFSALVSVLALLPLTTASPAPHPAPSPAPSPAPTAAPAGTAAAAAAAAATGPDYSELIPLASLAGISFPTNPAELLSLAPLASSLLAALPTAPVLTALETAAPPGFVSSIVHDPSFAASFESAFAAGSSPSWFLALPSSVRAYLHTYDGIGTAAGVLGGIESQESSVSASASASANGKNNTATTTTNPSSAAASSSTMVPDTGFSAGSMSAVPTSSSSATPKTTASAAGAPPAAGAGSAVWVAPVAVVAGVLGFAAGL